MGLDGFVWHDGPRTVVFGRGAVDGARDHLGESYVLLATERSRAAAPGVVAAAAHVLDVAPGQVDAVAAQLLDALPAGGARLVALGGGRVVDCAKALGAATERAVAAIPTTLSAAEMTWIHRPVAGLSGPISFTRPDVVINDPALSASQPPEALAASAANALAHAVEAPLTARAAPVPTLTAREAARLIAAAGADGDDPDRDALALGALLAGAAIDAAWYGLAHICSQTLVRVGGAGHGPANAVLLEHSAGALRRRFPDAMRATDDACGRPVDELARALASRADASRIRDLGVDPDALDACADAAAQRPELELTPPRADRDELRAIYDAAW